MLKARRPHEWEFEKVGEGGSALRINGYVQRFANDDGHSACTNHQKSRMF